MDSKRVIVFGCGDLAQVLACHLAQDSLYEVVAFTADREQVTVPRLLECEVIPFDEIEQHHPPSETEMLVAVGYSAVNRARAEVYHRCKEKGYTMATYVSSRAMFREPFTVGEGSIVFDGAVVHPFACIGRNVVVWGVSHIGHHSVIEDHCFLACATVAGRTRIGSRTFLGGNSCVTEGITVGAENIVGAGALITRDTKDGEIYRPVRTKPSPISSHRLWR